MPNVLRARKAGAPILGNSSLNALLISLREQMGQTGHELLFSKVCPFLHFFIATKIVYQEGSFAENLLNNFFKLALVNTQYRRVGVFVF